MITYVNTVLVSNLATGAIIDEAPAKASSMQAISTDAGKFIFMNCDPGIDPDDLYNVTTANAATINTLKVGIVTKKNNAVHLPNGTVEYHPIIKWSNEIKAADVRNFNTLEWEADTEDKVFIDFNNLSDDIISRFAEGGKRIIVRLTFKDMPHRFRKWTESYEYITKFADMNADTAAQATAKADAYKQLIAKDIATAINKEWKRARVSVTVGTYTPATKTFAAAANGKAIQIEALPYDDDDANDTINWANKVRFNANIYWTDPAGDGWESLNKNFPNGVIVEKNPGKTYPASGKLVRDHESKAQGYLGIINRGPGTWPIIKPEIEANINAHYDGITMEFENMYRAADDIFRKTKQTVEIYGLTGQLDDVIDIFEAFVDYKKD